MTTTPGSGYNAARPLCPHCGELNDGFTSARNPAARPKDGDYSVCLYCGGVSIFRENGTLRLPEPHEFDEAMTDPLVRRARITAMMSGITPASARGLMGRKQ